MKNVGKGKKSFHVVYMNLEKTHKRTTGKKFVCGARRPREGM